MLSKADLFVATMSQSRQMDGEASAFAGAAA